MWKTKTEIASLSEDVIALWLDAKVAKYQHGLWITAQSRIASTPIIVKTPAVGYGRGWMGRGQRFFLCVFYLSILEELKADFCLLMMILKQSCFKWWLEGVRFGEGVTVTRNERKRHLFLLQYKIVLFYPARFCSLHLNDKILKLSEGCQCILLQCY